LVLFLFWFFFFSSLEYAGNIFLTLYSTLIALALVGAVYFATKAFQTAKEQAVVLRDISVLVSFFLDWSCFSVYLSCFVGCLFFDYCYFMAICCCSS
jgi:hypothetical protein